MTIWAGTPCKKHVELPGGIARELLTGYAQPFHDHLIQGLPEELWWQEVQVHHQLPHHWKRIPFFFERVDWRDVVSAHRLIAHPLLVSTNAIIDSCRVCS